MSDFINFFFFRNSNFIKFRNYLDTTNPNATNWFISELEKVRTEAKIDSFKFDAGEIEWLPKNFWLVNDTITPDQYSINYARMAAQIKSPSGSMVEVRTGSKKLLN